MSDAADDQPGVSPIRLLPLYAAGFVTAFGAHSIAASLAGLTVRDHAGLLTLGLLLAVYPGAEVLLGPVFGTLADKVGTRRVLLGGLVAFAVATAAFLAADDPALVGLARFGQGAAAAALSPAVGAIGAPLTLAGGRGHAFGSYALWQGLGYAAGPALGGVLVAVGGYPLLFTTLAALATVVAGWTALAAPTVPALTGPSQSVVDLVRRMSTGSFRYPAAALAGATAALAVGVGFLPAIGLSHGLGPLATGAIVSVLTATAALTQPGIGRAHNAGRLPDHTGTAIGLLLSATGIAIAALLPGTTSLVCAGAIIGAGIGVLTPLGFAYLSRTSPPARLGQTLGAAEIGRELGSTAGPLIVGVIAAATTLSTGMLAVTVVLAAVANVLAVSGRAPLSADDNPRDRNGTGT